ncbi:MAG: biotin transporter BioY [Chlamydiota bacterium]
MTYPQTLEVRTSKTYPFLRDVSIVILASLLIGLFGKVAIPLPFTPIPISTQNSLILLMAVLLGSRRAFSATFAFILQGVVGLPVFAGALGGFAILLGPKGGYLVGYLAAAIVTGFLIEKLREKTIRNAFIALGLGNLVIYLFGAGYLSTFVGFQKAILLGIVPFLIGDLLKILICLKVLQWVGWGKK